MQRVIDDYEKMWLAKGKKVRVLQQPVTEKVYAQWLNTHLIAGDAPDISEQGMSSMLNNNPTYTARYYLPLTNIVNKPNIYNKGTALANVPWRERSSTACAAPTTPHCRTTTACPPPSSPSACSTTWT